jgi:hypothetical protein
MANLAKGSGVYVEGLSTTVKAMQELGASREVLTEPGYQAAMILIRAAKPLVPVKSGVLVSTLRPRRIQAGASVQAGGKRAPYANPIHWGWAVVSHAHKGTLKPGTYRGIMPQPFFSEALSYTKEEILNNYEALMRKAIDNLPGDKK